MLILPKRHGPRSTSDLFHIEFSFRFDLLLHMKHVDFKHKDGEGVREGRGEGCCPAALARCVVRTPAQN